MNWAARIVVLTILLMLAGSGLGCRTLPQLPPADFSTPGWRVRQGQALWKPRARRPELAGEILLATHSSGDFFVQFTKTPFPLATARTAGGRWQIEFGAGQRAWHGRGEPPSYFVWFQLPKALAGQSLARGWRCVRVTTNDWRLENSRSGETLEGSFGP